MESNDKLNEVIHQNKLMPYSHTVVDEIKKEVCDEDISRIDKYDDIDFEPFHENIFRKLSANFDNLSSIDQINDACKMLDDCLIENNILNKNGTSKFNLKGPAANCEFLKYRDIDDAFVDMVVSESTTKFINCEFPFKKIDLKPFKDPFFSFDFIDTQKNNEDSLSRDGDSESEEIEESESHVDYSLSENCASDSEVSDVEEGDESKEKDLLGLEKVNFDSDRIAHIKVEDITNSPAKSNETVNSDYSSIEICNESPLKDTVRDVRVIVRKISCDLSENGCIIDQQFLTPVKHLKHLPKETRQVARKKTGGVVNNINNVLNTDEFNREQKTLQLNAQLSKESDSTPNVFDKMTRAGKRDLERVLAESTANLVIQKTTQLISEKIKQLQSNEKDVSDGSSSEDESRENDIHKTAEIVTNTIIEFLTKSKCKKVEKLGKEINDEITSKVNLLKVDKEDENVKETPVIKNDQAVEMTDFIGENTEESCSKKVSRENIRQNFPKKKISKKTVSPVNSRRTLAEQFEEIARIEKDIINCELFTPLNDEQETLRRPTTRHSCSRNDTVSIGEDHEEPRRPITRQSMSKNDVIDDPEEPKRPSTRQSMTRSGKDSSTVDDLEEPKRPSTRQSVTRNEKDSSTVGDLEDPKRPSTRQSITRSEKDSVTVNDDPEEPKRPSTRQITRNEKDNTTVDEDFEEPNKPITRQTFIRNEKELNLASNEQEEVKRPKTRQSVAKNEKDIIFVEEHGQKEELKKPILRPRLEIDINYELLTSLVDNDSEDVRRPTTRQSAQKLKEIVKGNSENTFQGSEIKSTVKRKNNSRAKKNTSRRQSVKKQSEINLTKDDSTLANEKTSEKQFVIDLELSEDLVQMLNDSNENKSSKNNNNSTFSDRTIKASADSTTSETESNEMSANETVIAESNQQQPKINCSKDRIEETCGTHMLDSQVVHSLTNAVPISTTKEVLSNNDTTLRDVDCSMNGFIKNENLKTRLNLTLTTSRSRDSSDNSSDSSKNLEDVSKQIEDEHYEPIKEKVNLSKDQLRTSPNEKSLVQNAANKVIHSCREENTSEATDEPFQILNDMITDIEENLLKEEKKNSSANVKQVSGKDESNSLLLNQDISPYHSSNLEVTADSTSFLNYSMDDSFRLLIDEDSLKNNIIEDKMSEKHSTAVSNESHEKSSSTKPEIERIKPDLKMSTAVNESERFNLTEAKVKDLSKSKLVGKCDEFAVAKENISENVSVPKKETEIIKTNTEESDISSPGVSLSESKPLSAFKPLTNEEKIAQLTKRDPRLVNDKKIVNVLLRDPRLRNKIPKVEDKRENVAATNITNLKSSDAKPTEETTEPKSSELKSHDQKQVEPKSSELKTHDQKQVEPKFDEKQQSDSKQPASTVSEPKLLTKKLLESKPTRSKLIEPKVSGLKHPLPEVLDSPLSPDPEPVAPASTTSFLENDMKNLVSNSSSTKCDGLDHTQDQLRRKKTKKAIDKELLYKTPLSDLHDSHSERPTYERTIKKKRTASSSRNFTETNEERGNTLKHQRRSRTVEESRDERRAYNEPLDEQISQAYFPHESYDERHFMHSNEKRVHHRIDDRDYGEEEMYEGRNFHQNEREPTFSYEPRENYEQETYARRMFNDTNYGGTTQDSNDFQDNHIYSRREFYRRNRYAHDHDHFGNSSRLMDSSSNHQEDQLYAQQNNFSAAGDSAFRVSAYPAVSMLPDPMYSQKEDFDQSYGNMDTDSFSPPSSDLCPPPPPLIRSPSPELLRRDNYCPSPPHISRSSSPNERDYEEYNRAFHRNYENDELSFRGRNSSSSSNSNRTKRGGAGNYRRGSTRDYRHRWHEKSPPRKRFAGEHFRGREDDRGRWRRSPSWSPERSRHRSRERSLSPLRESRPWNSPREPLPWNSPRDRPWNSPRARSPSPPHRSNYRERSSYQHNKQKKNVTQIFKLFP